MTGYKVEPWLKTSKDDMFMVDLSEVLTMSESSDVEMISMYQRWLRDTTRSKNNEPKLSRKMGYISTVNDAKDILEKLYKSKESKG
jgi:hypothetical protein